MDPHNPFENPQNPGGPNPPQNPSSHWNDPGEGLNQQKNAGQQGYYNEQNPQFFQGPIQQGPAVEVAVPNGTVALVLGIIGLLLSCGIIGLVLNIVAIVLGSGAVKRGRQEPGKYTKSSLGQARAGQVLGIVGVSLFAVSIIAMITYFGVLQLNS